MRILVDPSEEVRWGYDDYAPRNVAPPAPKVVLNRRQRRILKAMTRKNRARSRP